MSEKRFRRWYHRTFDFFKLNSLMLSGVLSTTKEKIAALDASFMTKSGKKSGLPMNDKKVMGTYHELSSYGAIAA